jgi:hypothetical protein
MVPAAAPKFVTAIQSYITQVEALKASSPAAATAQQKFVSILKQEIPVVEQVGKAAAANDSSAYNAAADKFTAIQAQLHAANAALTAAL